MIIAGARRSAFGVTHAADLLGEDGVKETWGTQDAADAFREQGRGEVERPLYNDAQAGLVSSGGAGGGEGPVALSGVVRDIVGKLVARRGYKDIIVGE